MTDLHAEIARLEQAIANPAGWGRREWFEARKRLAELKLHRADRRDQRRDAGDLP